MATPGRCLSCDKGILLLYSKLTFFEPLAEYFKKKPFINSNNWIKN
jgi:hypothetical protein